MEPQSHDVIYFYDPGDDYGWLANFSNHPIKVGSILYRTVEHYFQAQKFSDEIIKGKIINSNSPEKAKAIAKENKHARVQNWVAIKEIVMMNGIRSKFTQHLDLKHELIKTDDKILIEKAPDDYYWGCGLDFSGLNRMGILLMRLRNEISKNHE